MNHDQHANLALMLRSFLVSLKKEITHRAVSSSMENKAGTIFSFVGNRDQALVSVLLPKGTEIMLSDALRVSDLVVSDKGYEPIVYWLYRLDWEINVMPNLMLLKIIYKD